MHSALTNLICRLLAIALMMLPFQTGQAAMIGADQAISSAATQADRTTVLDYLTRSEAAGEFRAMGLDAQAASDRVASMTDQEVSALAGKIDAVPAGGDGLVVLMLVVFVLWYFAFRR